MMTNKVEQELLLLFLLRGFFDIRVVLPATLGPKECFFVESLNIIAVIGT